MALWLCMILLDQNCTEERDLAALWFNQSSEGFQQYFTVTCSVPSRDSSASSTEGIARSTGTNIRSYLQLVGFVE